MTLHRLVLFRHGETAYNRQRRVQGHLDPGLTDLGQRQAELAAPVLARYAPQRLLTSDLTRAADTAAELATVADVPVKADPRLRETGLGIWEGLTHDQIETRWPGQFDAWRTDSTWAPEGGETRLEVAARAAPVVAELEDALATESADTAVLCTHGGLIVALTASLLGLPVEHWSVLRAVGNCRWTVLRRREHVADATTAGRWRLLGYNLGVDDVP